MLSKIDISTYHKRGRSSMFYKMCFSVVFLNGKLYGFKHLRKTSYTDLICSLARPTPPRG